MLWYCRINSAIANWTIAPSEFNTNDTAGHKEYVGEIQGVCTDGTVLSQIGYGYNLDQTSCAFNHSNGQQLGPASVFSTPSDGKFYFSYKCVPPPEPSPPPPLQPFVGGAFFLLSIQSKGSFLVYSWYCTACLATQWPAWKRANIWIISHEFILGFSLNLLHLGKSFATLQFANWQFNHPKEMMALKTLFLDMSLQHEWSWLTSCS